MRAKHTQTKFRGAVETGEMRNWRDWPLQPGAPATHVQVEIVDLR